MADGTSLLTLGFWAFAASVLVMIGTFQAVSDLAAIFENELCVVTQNYFLDFEVTACGWIHLILGLAVTFIRYRNVPLADVTATTSRSTR